MSQTPKYSMNYKPGLVSVIVRTKDRPEFLSHALASVSKQTYRPIEIVLVNDGGESVDAIVQEVSSADIELKILNNPSSLGRTEAASQGLELASGEYSVFLDDDDYFDPEHLSSLMEGMNTVSKEENWLHVVYSGARAVLVEGNEEHLISIQAEPFSLSRLQYGNFIPILTALFPTRVRELGVKFDTDFEAIETADAITNEPELSNVKGTIAMAKLGGNANSATSQWFFNLKDNSANLDLQNGGFTVFGEVTVQSMDVLEQITSLVHCGEIPVVNLNEEQCPDTTSGFSGENLFYINSVTVIDDDPNSSASLSPKENTLIDEDNSSDNDGSSSGGSLAWMLSLLALAGFARRK